MARRKPDPRDVPGLGVAAWVLLNALISKLIEKRRLSRQEVNDLMDDALSDLERADAHWDHDAFVVGRFLLEFEQKRRAGPRRRTRKHE
jgi:hypothetical protein